MARPRQRKGESAYEKRIRLYLERHPGATRQQARGHRLRPGERSEYARRTAGLSGEAKRAASGHRGYRDLLRALRDGDLVGIEPGPTRDSQGRYKTVRITVLDANGNERTFTMRKVTEERIRALVDRMEQVGAVSSPAFASGLAGFSLELPEAPELDALEAPEFPEAA